MTAVCLTIANYLLESMEIFGGCNQNKIASYVCTSCDVNVMRSLRMITLCLRSYLKKIGRVLLSLFKI